MSDKQVTEADIQEAMFSSLEGYAAFVVRSVEFSLRRELTTEEHQQVFEYVGNAINGITGGAA